MERVADINTVRELVRKGHTHLYISNYYQLLNPSTRGISERSVRRYCRAHDITRISDGELDELVQEFVNSYGHGYGRALMQGSIRSNLGVTVGVVSQRRVARSLNRIAPAAYNARARDVLERTNPIPYYAPYFGYKVHMDQNEKIGQNFGCTHVAIIDGCSRMVCGYASMEVKNPILIYEFVFRPALIKYGLWDQLRVDHGQEFVLCIFIQELLKEYRHDKHRQPWRQTKSTQNNVIERFWPELNSRVNYPIKRCMIRITEENDYDMSDPVVKYCISWVTLYIVTDAAVHLIESWNHHRVPGPMGCVPIDNMRETSRAVHLPSHYIPTTPEAVKMYEDLGGSLSRESNFGFDPLSMYDDKYESRQVLFSSNQPTGRELFSDVVHNRSDSIKSAIEQFYHLTVTL